MGGQGKWCGGTRGSGGTPVHAKIGGSIGGPADCAALGVWLSHGMFDRFVGAVHVGRCVRACVRSFGVVKRIIVLFRRLTRLFTVDTEGKFGRLGHASENNCLTPRLVEVLVGKRPCQVSCGGFHTAVVTEDGKLYTFGYGQRIVLCATRHGTLFWSLAMRLISPH